MTDGTQPAMLVLSGGEGYIDFRVGKQIFVMVCKVCRLNYKLYINKLWK